MGVDLSQSHSAFFSALSAGAVGSVRFLVTLVIGLRLLMFLGFGGYTFSNSHSDMQQIN